MRGHVALSCLLGLPALLACTDGDKGDDTGGDDGGNTAFAPMGGTWDVISEEIVIDSCSPEGAVSIGEVYDPDISFTLTDQGDGAWLIVTDDDDATTMNCTLENRAMICDRQVESMDMAVEGMDAVITVSRVLTLDYVTEVDGNHAMYVDAECTGEDCPALADFPCEMNMSGEVAHTGM